MELLNEKKMIFHKYLCKSASTTIDSTPWKTRIFIFIPFGNTPLLHQLQITTTQSIIELESSFYNTSRLSRYLACCWVNIITLLLFTRKMWLTTTKSGVSNIISLVLFSSSISLFTNVSSEMFGVEKLPIHI